MSQFEIIQIITAAISSVGFAILFNVHGKKLITAAIGGGVGWLVFLLLNRVVSEALGYFIVAMLISLYAESMARLLKAPTTLFIIPSLIPLIPGASLYYTMTYALRGDTSLFLPKAIATLKLAAALAIGVIVSAVLMKLILKIAQRIKERREKTVE